MSNPQKLSRNELVSDIGSGSATKSENAPTRRLVVAGIGATLFAPAVRAQGQLREVTIPLASTSFATASWRAAIELGCFRRNGLDVKAPVLEFASAGVAALISGSVPIALVGPGELVVANARGQQVALLTSVYWGQSGTLILAKDVADKSGVGRSAPLADRLKVLEGLPIASPSATSSFTVSYKGPADKIGVKMSFVYMAQPAMVAALETGAIKGYIASAPFWGPSVARGRGVNWISAPTGELPPENVPRGSTVCVTMRPFAEANPELMRQVLKSLRDFSEILEKTPDQARAAVGKIYPDVEPGTMDILFKAENVAWKYRDSTVDDLKHEIEFVKASGTAIPDIDKIDPATMLYVPPKT